MQKNHVLYSVTTYSSQYNIPLSFVQELYDRGLIDLQKEAEEYYIFEDQLPQLEHFTRLHCDFDINVAGIEVVEDLLSRINELREQTRLLKSKVSLLRELNG
ncbi:MAG: chaperone modulator CbpM [Chitinophagaceae bacterium]